FFVASIKLGCIHSLFWVFPSRKQELIVWHIYIVKLPTVLSLNELNFNFLIREHPFHDFVSSIPLGIMPSLLPSLSYTFKSSLNLNGIYHTPIPIHLSHVVRFANFNATSLKVALSRAVLNHLSPRSSSGNTVIKG